MFVTVIIYDSYERLVAWHDTLEAANKHLAEHGARGVYGQDYFIAVVVQREYVLPAFVKMDRSEDG